MEDTLYHLVDLYRRSPGWIKRFVGTGYGMLPYAFRYGKKYTEYRRLAERGRGWSEHEHKTWQLRQLQVLVKYAWDHIPYYRRTFQEYGVMPSDLKSLEDLSRFPSLTREQIRDNFADLVKPETPGFERIYTATSGSSGVPLELYHHKGITRAKERAFLYELWSHFGYGPGDKAVLFRGEVIEEDRAPWYFDPIDCHLVMSSYKLNEARVSDYCRKMRQFKPAAIRGYPFVIYRLVRLMQATGEAPLSLKTVILESENIYPAQREAIEAFFGCQVCHYYGHTERLVFGGNCPGNNDYHMHPQYGYMEVLTPDSVEVETGEEGELVATGFDNLVMPLIRYRTQDFVVKGGWARACSCGFPTLMNVNGRAEEYVFLKSGRREPFHNLLAGIHGKLWGWVDKIQCIQDEAGVLRLLVIPAEGREADKVINAYKAEIMKRVGTYELDILGEVVDDIPVTRSGKTKIFMQSIT